MMKYGINDVRAFAGNDLRFLRQFARASIRRSPPGSEVKAR